MFRIICVWGGGTLIIKHSGHDEMFRFNNYMIIVTLYDERDLI